MFGVANVEFEPRVRPSAEPIRSPLRLLDADRIDEAAKKETRNREVHLPPISAYRWWARRTEAVNGAILDALASDRDERLLVADPFAGGGIIPLAALIRGHRVYAQDLNPWAAQGLAGMLGLPALAELRDAAEKLKAQADATLTRAYGTSMSDGSSGVISHTFRVATAACTACGHRHRLFPHALVTLKRRRERGRPEAFLACAAGHLFTGSEGAATQCPECDRVVDPSDDYTRQRVVACPACGTQDRLEVRAREGSWRWEVVLVERTMGRASRELDRPTPIEIAQADSDEWQPRRSLGEIPDGQETRVLRRHGFRSWDDIYPARQRAVIELLLDLAAEATDDVRVRRALELAVTGTAEMAGLLSRWDRFYLKSYESMAGHRFNFTTFAAEPNVWGAPASGRGTIQRRLRSFEKAAEWMSIKGRAGTQVEGPLFAQSPIRPLPAAVDIRVVEGSSERMLLRAGSVDVALTDPPYHDDVQYGELSLPLRAWAQLSTAHLAGEASVNPALSGMEPRSYRELLTRIFREVRRTLRSDGHLIFSYANREPEAWVALFGALRDAGFRSAGYAVVHSENETDYAKRGVRACTLDLVMDLVPTGPQAIEQWRPARTGSSEESRFLAELGEAFMSLDQLGEGWESGLTARLRETPFLSASERPARSAPEL